jgi:hypothetical protein
MAEGHEMKDLDNGSKQRRKKDRKGGREDRSWGE